MTSPRRIAAWTGATLALVAITVTALSVASLGDPSRLGAVAGPTFMSAARSGVLAAGWVLVLAPGRVLTMRRMPWIAAAAVVGSLVAGFASGQALGVVFIQARAAGWPIGVVLAVGDAVSFVLHAVGIGVALWAAMRAVAGPPRREIVGAEADHAQAGRVDVDDRKAEDADVGADHGDAEALADGRVVWLALGVYMSAALAMEAVFVGRTLRFGPEANLTVDDMLHWAWAALLLASAVTVGVLARRSLRQGASRRQWATCFVVGLAVSAPLFLVSVRAAWQATRAVGLPPEALAPAITLLWAVLTMAASAALLGRKKRPATSPA